MSDHDPAATVREGARRFMREQHEAMRDIVRDLSDEALNWQPPVQGEANSIAQMLSHALESERFQTIQAVDEQVDRQREAEFAVHRSAQEMLALIDRADGEIDAILDRLRAEHLDKPITRMLVGQQRTRTGLLWLLGALSHTREHIGQATLTRQMFESRT